MKILPLRKIVLVSFQDEASVRGAPVIAALKRLGAMDPIVLDFRGSFALAAYAGSYLPSWVGQDQAKRALGPSIVTTVIDPGNMFCFLLRSI